VIDLLGRYPASLFWVFYVGYVAGVFQVIGWMR